MSKAAKQLFEGLKQVAQVGLEVTISGLSRLPGEAYVEGERLMVQGTMEAASGLFSGQSNAFVPYGPGQYTPSQEQHKQHEYEHEHER